ncbi:MAG: TonB-dependent receptor, partial [Muribaculaceae bacterium]|nr:TonB-dependent receptor [Muribaculaceae bacterium]
AYHYQSRLRTLNLQALAEYQHTFADKHDLGLMVGYESYESNNEYVEAIGSNLYNPGQWAVNNTIDQRRGYGASNGYATRGIFGRFKYNFDERIFFMASYRRDASSRFHPDHRWGNFWSASIAWDMKKEAFLREITNIDMLKLKFSFGQNGNDGIGNNYAYLDQYTLTGADGVFNDATLAYKGNPEITWETSNNLNAGVDFSFFKGRISGTLEYYQRQVSDMLFNIPVSPSLGYGSIPMNIGSMRNNGVELELNLRPIDLKTIPWDVYANFTAPNNKVIKLAPEILNEKGEWINGTRIYREGESMYQLYLVKYAGVNAENGEAMYYGGGKHYEINGVPYLTAAGAIPVDDDGNLLVPSDESAVLVDGEFVTRNWATAYNSNRASTGNIMPKLYGGFGTSINAYGFDASVNFAYQCGGRVFDSSYQSYMNAMLASNIGQNVHVDILNAWTPENTATDVPRISTTDQYTNSTSDRFLISSNYLSLSNITVGYTIPEKFTAKAYLHNVRIYFSGENVAL